MPCGGECEAELTCPRSRGSTTLHRCAMQRDPAVCVYRKAVFVNTTSCLDMSIWLKEPRPACESSDEKEDGLYHREVAENPLCGEKGEQTPQSLHARAEAGRG